MSRQSSVPEPLGETANLARFRHLTGAWRWLFGTFTLAGISIAVNQIFGLEFLAGIVILDNSYLYLLIGLFVSLVFLIFPAFSRSSRARVPWYDICLFALAVAISGYYALNGLRSIEEGWEFESPILPVVLAFALWALIMEAVRRAGGLAIFIIFGVLSFYPVFADADFIPAMLSGMAQDIVGTARYHVMSEESVLGIPMRVFGTLIIGFIIFGVTLQSTGGGRFFINLAFALVGGVRGGPAKVAIIASGLFGSLSGSVVTNVLTTGAMTIPAMKRAGYPPRYAAGIEACASTGGVLMPPVMGATAFVMASFLDIPYLTVAAAAAFPSLLYFYGLFVQIDAYAARNGIRGLAKSELPSTATTLKEGWFYLFAFFLLIFLLVYMKREAHAPFYATVALLALSQFGKLGPRDPWYYLLGAGIIGYMGLVLSSIYFSADYVIVVPVSAALAVLVLSQVPARIRITLGEVQGFVEANGRLLAELVAILAAVGLIIGGLMMTGMAGTFSGDLVRVAGGEVVLLLLMGAATSFILGIGMTVTAAYIFLAIVLAPALVDLGLDSIAVHLFILYWGMVSYITPPVALGAFAAASLAGDRPIRTGFEAMRLGSVIYFLPFFFVLNPALVLNGTAPAILVEGATALFGVTLIASGLQGHLVWVGSLGNAIPALGARGGLVAAGLLLAYPESTSNLIGLALLAPAVVLGRLARIVTSP
ncbi:MAG: TRAP transporter fused permease subunit [Alphaproteobacteria bacterium]|nr:TRAP transporter fused permease subunit [Alphaproteobacteria bacterium]MDP6517059.1 TRAP transporter fused permease subunit [Alphaproteobacteria bacterium]